MDGYFDILSFGAKGDGLTDDTVSIQKALDAASVCHGVVTVPPGNYLCGTLKMHSGTELRGNADFSYRDSMGGTLKLMAGNHKCLIDMTYAYGAKISSLCLAGRGGDDPLKPHGIMIDKDDYGKQEDTPCIDNCRIELFGGNAIHLSRIWCFSVRHSHMFKNGGHALYVRGWDGFVIDNWMSGNGGAGYGATEENASVTMTGNRIEWNRAGGILIRHGSHYNITGNYIDRSGNAGISLVDTRVISLAGNVIYRSGKVEWSSGNEFDSVQFKLENSEGVTFTGNTMDANRDDGGKGVYSPLYGISVKNCKSCVVSMNTMAGGALRELLIEENNTDTVIKDNPGHLKRV